MTVWTAFARNARIASAMGAMQKRNLLSRARIVSADGPVVSLTTYGRRTRLVHLAIESIARGTVLPSRLILWLDEEDYLENPTPGLRRLMRRGLEIRRTPNYGPHKKYFPFVMSAESHVVPLVTADDDTLYPQGWLETLLRAHTRVPHAIVACRAHRVEFENKGMAPYSEWTHGVPGTLSLRNFGVGVGGILYPAPFLDKVRERGDGFTTVAPFADDVWLHATAVKDCRPIAFVGDLPEEVFLPLRGSRTRGLFSSNIDSGGNDRQIAQTYAEDDIVTLRSAETTTF